MQEQTLSNVNNAKIAAEVDDDGNLVATIKFKATTSPQALARLANFLKNGGPITAAFQTPQLAFDLSFTEIKPIDAGPKEEKPKAEKKGKPADNGKGTKAEATAATPAPAPEVEEKPKQPA